MTPRRTSIAVVIVEWRAAHLGRGLLDVARLANDLRTRGESPDGLYEAYREASGERFGPEAIRAAELVDEAIHAAPTY